MRADLLGPRAEMSPAELGQLLPGAALPDGLTLRLAEVTAGVYRAEVQGPDSQLVAGHVATDPAEAVRVAVERMSMPAPAGVAWPRDRVVSVAVGVLLGAAAAWWMWGPWGAG